MINDCCIDDCEIFQQNNKQTILVCDHCRHFGNQSLETIKSIAHELKKDYWRCIQT